MKFGNYLKTLLTIIISSFFALGLLLGVLILALGSISGHLEFDVDIERLDSLWMFIGLPVAMTLICVLISPISFLVHRYALRR